MRVPNLAADYAFNETVKDVAVIVYVAGTLTSASHQNGVMRRVLPAAEFEYSDSGLGSVTGLSALVRRLQP